MDADPPGHDLTRALTAGSPSHLRRGIGALVTGVVLLTAVVTAWLLLSATMTLGLGLVLLVLGAVALQLAIGGAVRLRHPEPPDVDLGHDEGTGLGGTAGGSWRCTLLGHRQTFRARTGTTPPHWECSRCGVRSRSHVVGGQRWRCGLPFADHLYDGIGASENAPQHWRCRRCGHRRYTAPLSVGESMEGTRAATTWVKRED